MVSYLCTYVVHNYDTVPDSRAFDALSAAARARSKTGPEVMFVETRRAAAAAAASARITPVSASPRTAGDADFAPRTPNSATVAAVSAICAGGSLAPSRAVVRSAGVSALRTGA